MKPLTSAPLIVLLLAGLSLLLRQDLQNLALYQGSARLQTGDEAGAEAAYRRAAALGAANAPLTYNLGVNLYRKGDYPRAGELFAAALATARPDLTVAVRYNLGNSEFRQAERLSVDHPEAARRLMRQAIADYGLALAQTPNASDVVANLGLAQARLAALGEGTGGERGQGKKMPAARANPAGQPAAGGGARTKTGQTRPTAGSSAKADAHEAAQADKTASSGKPRPELTPSQAERLLNEARGREKPTGLLHADTQNGALAKPDKDW